VPPASAYSWATSMAPNNQGVYRISFLIEKPQTTFYGLKRCQDIYKSLQQLGRDRCPSEDHVHVSASGQARDVLVREEVSSVRRHPGTLPSAALGFVSAAWMMDAGTDSTGRIPPQAEAPVSLYFLPTSRNEAYPNTSFILHLGTTLEHGRPRS